MSIEDPSNRNRSMDLFDQNTSLDKDRPLAERLRPQDLEQIVGQEEVLKKDSWLRKSLESDQFPSLILWGPPGTGKTTFAKIIATRTKKNFIALNAIATGAKEIREICENAKTQKKMYQRGTVLFVDEIHRLNRAQQDVFLPYVESGDIILIGATTENPSFEVNSALLSRSRVIPFKRHSDESLLKILESAFQEYELKPESLLKEDALIYIIQLADGDARRLLNRVEEIILYYRNSNDLDVFPVNVEKLKDLLGSKTLYHDKSGESHYDTISAFIKSIRGSDPDAALYYLARLVEGGEDPKFIARRLVILASEDIGNADPKALTIATSGFQAVEVIGYPECAINLAQVVVYLASAPKSNSSYMGLKKAQAEVQKSGQLPIPLSVRNAPTKLMKEQGYGKDYNYAHNGERGWQEQQFLPDEIKDKKFYESKGLGFEKKMNEYLEWLKSKKN